MLNIEWESSIGILKADQHDRLSGVFGAAHVITTDLVEELLLPFVLALELL